MNFFSAARLSDESVLKSIPSAFRQEHRGLAAGLVLIAEAEKRRLYRRAAHSSMLSWCIGTLPLSEAAALNRIRAARVVRRFPALLEPLEDGRLHLGALLLLARWLRPENVDWWISAASHKSKREIQWLIRDFVAPELSAPAEAEPSDSLFTAALPLLDEPRGRATEPVNGPTAESEGVAVTIHAVSSMTVPETPQAPSESVAATIRAVADPPQETLARAKWRVHSPGVYELRLLFGEVPYARVRLLHELLSHRFSETEQTKVILHAVEVAIREAQRVRFAATMKPRATWRMSASRAVPAAVRRAVWERDGGRCTFTTADGKRCDERRLIQFDHIIPVARGGRSTVENLRLLCRPHNQLAAELVFGASFMEQKRVRPS